MSDTGRKLTIRMPDNPRLKKAVVHKLHFDPGARVSMGYPVLTLKARRREHMVRAPRNGRIVPLVSEGDEVSGGDPLYILNVNEAALRETNEDTRALVPVQKARWQPEATAEEIRAIDRARPAVAKGGWISRFVSEDWADQFAGDWGKPILVLALYVLACFALLPILNAISRETSLPTHALLFGGSVLFAIAVFLLYAPQAIGLPRSAIRLVSVSWVAISALAIFHRPEVPTDISLSGASGPIAEVFFRDEAEEQLADASDAVTTSLPSSAPSAEPISITKSGVLVGRTPGIVAPAHTPPQSELTVEFAANDPHGVAVRSWARVTPTRGAGDALAKPLEDPVQHTFGPDLGVPQHTPVPALSDTAPEMPASFLIASLLDETVVSTAPVGKATDAHPLTAPPEYSWSAVTALGAEAEPTFVVAADQTLPIEGAASGRTSSPGVPAWVSEAAIPVIMSEGYGTIPAGDPAFVKPSRFEAPQMATAPSGLRGVASPDLILLAALRSGEDAWMADQANLLAGLLVASDSRSWQPLGALPVEQDRVAALDAPGRTILTDIEVSALESLRSAEDLVQVISVMRGDGAKAPPFADQAVRYAATVPSGWQPFGVPAVLSNTEEGPTVPDMPPWEPAPPTFAQRLLLFLYFDDPRLESHPDLGEQWRAAVSPELEAAIHKSEVEDVREIVQVVNWCAAANDPGKEKERNLPGGAYTTAILSDRIRLLQVRVSVDPEMVGRLEQELPIFGGAEPGFFHNRYPLLGSEPGTPVMDRARDYLLGLSNRDRDPNTPQDISGGMYFDSATALNNALRQSGCAGAFWNNGDGPENMIGRDLAKLIDS